MLRTSKPLVVTMLGAVLAACGGPTQTNAGGLPAQPINPQAPASTGSTSSSAPEQPASAGPSRCVSTDVKGVFGPGDSAYSGSVQRSIVITNISDHTCTVYGYGGLELHIGGDGSTLPATLTREPSPAPRTVTLKPNAKAYKKVLWTVPQGDDQEGNCAQGASYALVTLPDDNRTIEVYPDDGSADLGTICDGQVRGYAWTATDPAQSG